MGKMELPPAPETCIGPVKAWSQPITIPTHSPLAADPNPMFLESRVYQGSSGRVYPLPFIDRIESQPLLRQWQALHLENEFVRLMILPEIGGRIHIGFDKITGYDFFYRQNVIKPALVGLAGPWISGGVEFNWPQHHRPATFMPVNTEIERSPDGSVTIWCSDHDPMERMRGTHGVCLHPSRSVVELKVRLFNRTALTQTFLWWANVGVHVDENYQSIFPPDVRYVADHARRGISTFPLCTGTYYGINYGMRAQRGIPPDQQPPQFIPRLDYPPNDLSRYANIPVPTSYMAVDSKYDFLAGYDHGKHAGVVHIANHHISPGKKQWTWGNHNFGYAWDRNLTDADGPYIELMAGVYTDNQPDFSFLAPYETKTFSQFWFPLRDLPRLRAANVNAAISLQTENDALTIAVLATKPFAQAHITLRDNQANLLAEWAADLSPANTFTATIPATTSEPTLLVEASDGSEIIRFEPHQSRTSIPPEPATEPPLPSQIKSQDELYLTGVHLQQYRHATRMPEIYWQEALRRDPTDYRCNTAMGSFHLRRGEFLTAKTYFRKAIASLTHCNHNPADGEPWYLLGITLRFLGEFDDAYAALYKSTWNQAWVAAGHLALAEIDASRHQWEPALQHVSRSLAHNSENLNARNLKAHLLRKLSRPADSDALIAESLQLDPLDPWSLHLAGKPLPFPNQQLLDLAFDYARSHFFHESAQVLTQIDLSATDGSVPICLYALASFLENVGDSRGASETRANAKTASPTYCFPSRLEELLLLQEQVHRDPKDAKALYYLGNLLYDKRRHQEAIDCWRRSAVLDPHFPTVSRNLGIGFFNILHDHSEAATAFDKAFAANPQDARVLFERDQLWKRLGRPLLARLAELEAFSDLVNRRDDLSLELATLYNQTDQPQKALAILNSRQFQPWEGGEGLAIAQYVRAHLALGRTALEADQLQLALEHFRVALEIPHNLSEARHVLANQSNIYYWLGVTYEQLGETAAAVKWWRRAVTQAGDFQNMSVTPFSEMTFYSALSLRRMGDPAKSNSLAEDLSAYSSRLAHKKATIDYFATSLPTMLLFTDDLAKRQKVTASILHAQADLLQGSADKAALALRRILRSDPSNEVAFDMLKELPLHANLTAHLRDSKRNA